MKQAYVIVDNGSEEIINFIPGVVYVGENSRVISFDGEFNCKREKTAVMRIWKAIAKYMQSEKVANEILNIFKNWENIQETIFADGGALLPEMKKAQFFADYGLKIEIEYIDDCGYYVQVTFKKPAAVEEKAAATKAQIYTGDVSLMYAGNTNNGNKKFYVEFYAGGMITRGNSKPNAAWPAEFKTGFYKNVKVAYHVTKSNKVIFDNIERMEA